MGCEIFLPREMELADSPNLEQDECVLSRDVAICEVVAVRIDIDIQNVAILDCRDA